MALSLVKLEVMEDQGSKRCSQVSSESGTSESVHWVLGTRPFGPQDRTFKVKGEPVLHGQVLPILLLSRAALGTVGVAETTDPIRSPEF